MLCDIKPYSAFVEAFDMPDDRKAELIRIVWTMMQSFVDRAFGDAPEQSVRQKRLEPLTACGRDALGSNLTLTPTYNEAAAKEGGRKKKP